MDRVQRLDLDIQADALHVEQRRIHAVAARAGSQTDNAAGGHGTWERWADRTECNLEPDIPGAEYIVASAGEKGGLVSVRSRSRADRPLDEGFPAPCLSAAGCPSTARGNSAETPWQPVP